MFNNFLRMKDVLRRVNDGAHSDALRKFNADPRMSVFLLANQLGLDVEQRPLRKGSSGYLAQDEWSESGFKIIVNSNEPQQRRRFTILHEIIHFLFHAEKRDLLTDSILRDTAGHLYDADEIHEEREANSAAAALLFADGNLRAAMVAHDGDVDKVARHFGVSAYVVRKGVKDFAIL